jgi:hypothetical protein
MITAANGPPLRFFGVPGGAAIICCTGKGDGG